MSRSSPLSPLNPFRAASLLTMATVLSACGGSGGGSDSDNGADADTIAIDDFVELSASGRVPLVGLADMAALNLDGENAEATVAAALQAIAQAMQLGNGDGAIGPFQDLLAQAGGAGFDFSAFTGAQFDGFLQRDAEGLADGITEIDCPVSGQFVLALDVPDEAVPDLAAAGLDLRSCDLGNDLLLTGKLDIEVSGELGALDAGLEALDNATLSVVASALEIHSSPYGFRTNGTLAVAVQPLAVGTSVMVTLDLDYASVGEAISWRDFQIEASKDAATGAFSVVADGVLRLNLPERVNGQFAVTTQRPISGITGSNPEAGELRIDGEGDSRITVTFASGGDVLIRLFDGEEELPLELDSSWRELQALLAQSGGAAGS